MVGKTSLHSGSTSQHCKPTVMSAAFPTGAVGLHVFAQFFTCAKCVRVVATRVDPDPALNRRWVRERGYFPSRATIDFALETRVHPADKLTVEFRLS